MPLSQELLKAIYSSFVPVSESDVLPNENPKRRTRPNQLQPRLLTEFILIKDGKHIVPNYQDCTPEFLEGVEAYGFMASPCPNTKWPLWTGLWEMYSAPLPGRNGAVSFRLVHIKTITGIHKEVDVNYLNGNAPGMWLHGTQGFYYGLLSACPSYESDWGQAVQTWPGDDYGPGGSLPFQRVNLPVGPPRWWHRNDLPIGIMDGVKRYWTNVTKDYEAYQKLLTGDTSSEIEGAVKPEPKPKSKTVTSRPQNRALKHSHKRSEKRLGISDLYGDTNLDSTAGSPTDRSSTRVVGGSSKKRRRGRVELVGDHESSDAEPAKDERQPIDAQLDATTRNLVQNSGKHSSEVASSSSIEKPCERPIKRAKMLSVAELAGAPPPEQETRELRLTWEEQVESRGKNSDPSTSACHVAGLTPLSSSLPASRVPIPPVAGKGSSPAHLWGTLDTQEQEIPASRVFKPSIEHRGVLFEGTSGAEDRSHRYAQGRAQLEGLLEGVRGISVGLAPGLYSRSVDDVRLARPSNMAADTSGRSSSAPLALAYVDHTTLPGNQGPRFSPASQHQRISPEDISCLNQVVPRTPSSSSRPSGLMSTRIVSPSLAPFPEVENMPSTHVNLARYDRTIADRSTVPMSESLLGSLDEYAYRSSARYRNSSA